MGGFKKYTVELGATMGRARNSITVEMQVPNDATEDEIEEMLQDLWSEHANEIVDDSWVDIKRISDATT